MDPEEIARQLAEARANGYNDVEIKERFASVGVDWSPEPVAQTPPKPGLKQELNEGAASVLQGITANVAGLMDPKLRQASKDFNSRHKVIGGGLNLAGTALSTLAFPASLGVRVLGRGLVGGGSAAIAAGAEGEGTAGERLKRAATAAPIGAAAGIAIPAIAGGVARGTSRLLKPYMSKTRTIADAVGPLLPPDAAARMARIEKLAPGAATPASLSPDIPASTRVIGANTKVALKAQEASEGRLVKLKTATEDMGPKYEELLAPKGVPRHGRLTPTELEDGPDIAPIFRANGLFADNTEELTRVQGLRNTIRAKKDALWQTAQRGKGGGPEVHKLNEQFKILTQWLEKHSPGISALDKDYRLLNDARRAEEVILKNVRQSRKSYASSRSAGIEPGSPGASLPSKNGFFQGLLAPDRKKLAEVADRLLLQPGQIPKDLLRARTRAIQGPSGRAGLLAAFGLGSQVAPQLTGGLLGDE